MKLEEVLQEIDAGILITNADFNVIWANKFEEDYYKKPVLGLWVVDCHQESNKEKITEFLERFKSGELKTFIKTTPHGMRITYSSYFEEGKFAGIVRTRMFLNT